MTKIKAVTSREIKANRLLKLSVREDGLPVLTYADNGFPHFRSSKDVEKGKEVTINVTGRYVWKVEAGEDLFAGEAVYAGDEGKLYARRRGSKTPADLCGYVASNAKEGDVVELVRNFQMNGNWLKEVSDQLNITDNDDDESPEPEPEPEPNPDPEPENPEEGDDGEEKEEESGE